VGNQNQVSQCYADKFNALEAEFRGAADKLDRPALDIDNLWSSFAALVLDLSSKRDVENTLKIVKISLVEFAKQAAENSLNFKEIFDFFKKIREIFTEHFKEIESPAVRGPIFFLLDDFEYCLFQEWLRRETLPYHKKLREANLKYRLRYFSIIFSMSEVWSFLFARFIPAVP